jgi:hypothetical protein
LERTTFEAFRGIGVEGSVVLFTIVMVILPPCVPLFIAVKQLFKVGYVPVSVPIVATTFTFCANATLSENIRIKVVRKCFDFDRILYKFSIEFNLLFSTHKDTEKK